MASNVSVSELCSVESSADRMLATGSMSTISTPLADSCQVFDLPLIGSDLTRITADLFANIPTVDSGSVTTIIDINGLTGGSDFDATNQMTLFPANDPNMSQSLLASNIFATAAESISYDLQNNSSNVIQLSSDTIETKSSQIGYKRVFERKPKSLVKKSRKPLTTQIIAVYEDNGEEAITDSTSDYTKSGTLLKCNYCSHECHRLQEMRRHLKPHMEDKPFKCEECDQTFNVEINLRLHICGQHYKTTDSKPMCCECDKRFTRLASLKSHLTVHQKEELLSCGQCSQQFPTHYYLNKHINSDHLNVQKKIKSSDKVSLPKPEHVCGVCSQKFVNNSLLKEHQKLHLKINSSLKHKTYKKWIDRSDFRHKCNTCGKAFKKNCQLVRHNRIHSGEKPFVCEFCGTAFNQKSSLDIHRTKHTGERKHECKFCGAQFNQSGNMRSHIRRLHAPQADTPLSQLFRCPFCSCVFKKLGILNCHISRRHPLEANEASVLQNTDVVTNDSSTSRLDASIDDRLGDLLSKALERSGVKNDSEVERCGLQQIAQLFDPATGSRQTHIVRRVGNISYRQCLYCHKEFKKSSDLVRHYRIHTHDKPFKCSQCYRAFTVKGTLSAHMRTHNGLKPYVCQLCDRRFSTSQSLKVHVRLHTGALPYHCQHCDKSFRTLGHLKTHSSLHTRQNHSAADNPILVANKIRRKDIDQSLLERIQLDGPLLLVNSTDESEAQNETNCEQNSLKPDAKRKHKCCHCGKGFKKNSHLTQHIRSHTGEKPYQCDQCLQCFVAKSSLKIHMQIHSKVKPFECSECQFAFATRGSLTRHMLRHSSDRPFMCPYCAKTFKSSLNCKKHLKLHRTEFAIQLMSEQSKQNESQKENQISENVVSVSDDSPKVVSLLDKSLEQTTLTEANVQSNDIFTNIDCNLSSVGNQSDGPSAVNPTADQTMQTIESQVVEPVLHTFVTLADSSRPFPCQVCGLAFKKLSHLKQHERRHTGERPFKCEICGREFATRGVLTNHLNTHSSTKNFRCDICNSTFVTNNSLRRHLRTVHTFYTCPHCAVKCKSRSSLEKHFESVHNLVIQTMEPVMESANNELIFDSCPPMDTTTDAMVGLESIDQKVDENGDNQSKALRLNQCEFCPKSFKKPSDLQRHRRIHTGEKPYNCHICSKSFTVKSTLDCHLITHKGLKNFKCEICGTAFATSGSLKVHNRLHTGQKPFECDLCGERFRTSGHRKAHIDKHNKTKAGPQIEATGVPQSNALVKASVATEELIVPIELNPSLASDVLRIAVPASGGQSELFSQLFQIDASLIQQLQSQGFVITETDGIDIIGEPITAITTTLF